MSRQEIIYYAAWLIAALLFIGVNIYADVARARSYCFPVDPDHIPIMATTATRALCPRTPTLQKPYCPTP